MTVGQQNFEDLLDGEIQRTEEHQADVQIVNPHGAKLPSNKEQQKSVWIT